MMAAQIAVLPQYSLASALEALQYRMELEKSRMENALANPSSVTLPVSLLPSSHSALALKDTKDKDEEPRAPSELMQRGRLAMEFKLDSKKAVVERTGAKYDSSSTPAGWFVCAPEHVPDLDGYDRLTLIRELSASKSLSLLVRSSQQAANTRGYVPASPRGSGSNMPGVNPSPPNRTFGNLVATPGHRTNLTADSTPKRQSASTLSVATPSTPTNPTSLPIPKVVFPSNSLLDSGKLKAIESITPQKSDSFSAEPHKHSLPGVKSASSSKGNLFDEEEEHTTSEEEEDWDLIDDMDSSPKDKSSTNSTVAPLKGFISPSQFNSTVRPGLPTLIQPKPAKASGGGSILQTAFDKFDGFSSGDDEDVFAEEDDFTDMSPVERSTTPELPKDEFPRHVPSSLVAS